MHQINEGLYCTSSKQKNNYKILYNLKTKNYTKNTYMIILKTIHNKYIAKRKVSLCKRTVIVSSFIIE